MGYGHHYVPRCPKCLVIDEVWHDIPKPSRIDVNGGEWWSPGISAWNCQAQYEEQVEQLKIDLELRRKAKSGCQPRQPRLWGNSMRR